jgi:pyruvate-formate lyase-activating enzyme
LKTTFKGAPLHVTVPEDQRWLSVVFAALSKVGLLVEHLVLADGKLELRLGFPDQAPLTVSLTKADGATPGWGQVQGFTIGYLGAGDIDERHRRLLGILQRVLTKLGSALPTVLSGFAFIGRCDPPYEEALPRMFPFVTVERSTFAGSSATEVLARATSRCSQRCPFCSGPEHEEPAPEVLRDCFESVAELLPGAVLSITGGEPTLREGFLDEALHALSLSGIGEVQIQTNALSFAERLDPADLPASDRLLFFVSLHALEEEIYDACTGTRGSMERAIAGIHRLLDAGHRVVLNTVINTRNLTHINDYIEAVQLRFPGDNRPALHFSTLICQEWNPTAADYLVQYSEMSPVIARAAARINELYGADSEAFSSTHASLPPCLFVEDFPNETFREAQLGAAETGYEDLTRTWVKAERCRRCRADGHCLGVPRPYAVRFGLDELVPLARDDGTS